MAAGEEGKKTHRWMEMALVSGEWQERLGTAMISFQIMDGGFLLPEEPDGESKVLLGV